MSSTVFHGALLRLTSYSDGQFSCSSAIRVHGEKCGLVDGYRAETVAGGRTATSIDDVAIVRRTCVKKKRR
ncbi:hypothetical protein RvY_02413 [Ramazzottius varieornatus]|uniref:Uncharacterized protein n=1 Tax=Ramazzottius varieornatus TaxID=947166 RepID=A0A1D1UJN0_RAMVA|nr:hypothetical protein RvY_02413 [Ramazzottius varieornatus]